MRIDNDQILDDFSNSKRDYSKFAVASKEKRFLNYLIDLIGYYIFAFVVGIVLAIFANALGYNDEFQEWINPPNRIRDYIFTVITLFLYYFLLEFMLNGKTLGKLFTKTRAVNKSGSVLTIHSSTGRSLARVVPFEPFSFLGNDAGWHDKWSGTYVIDETKRLD